jgi:hypothetical protein
MRFSNRNDVIIFVQNRNHSETQDTAPLLESIQKIAYHHAANLEASCQELNRRFPLIAFRNFVADAEHQCATILKSAIISSVPEMTNMNAGFNLLTLQSPSFLMDTEERILFDAALRR